MNFNNIIPNINTDSQNSASDQNMAFSSDTLCSPYIVPINGEKNIHVNLESKYEKAFKEPYYYTDINFATRGTEKLSKVPP